MFKSRLSVQHKIKTTQYGVFGVSKEHNLLMMSFPSITKLSVSTCISYISVNMRLRIPPQLKVCWISSSFIFTWLRWPTPTLNICSLHHHVFKEETYPLHQSHVVFLAQLIQYACACSYYSDIINMERNAPQTTVA